MTRITHVQETPIATIWLIQLAAENQNEWMNTVTLNKVLQTAHSAIYTLQHFFWSEFVLSVRLTVKLLLHRLAPVFLATMVHFWLCIHIYLFVFKVLCVCLTVSRKPFLRNCWIIKLGNLTFIQGHTDLNTATNISNNSNRQLLYTVQIFLYNKNSMH